MNEAQKTCNGTDMRCTFYHFVNHGYENIGTLSVNKELFDDLLMKFDNWLLTAENIDKSDVHGKTTKGYSLDATSINVNDRYIKEGKVFISSDVSKANGLDTNQGKDSNISKFDDDKINAHLVKNPDETHHNNHHHKWKNGNHIKLDAKYNDEHRYFEVFLPKDKQTGKPRTIYVEVDRDKNEFILLDEDIDKKLHGIKPIKIELDELHEIAETAFSDLVKSSNHKGHIHYNLDEDNRLMTSDLNTNPELDNHEIHSGIDADELMQHILNSSVCNSNICNINASQQLTFDNTTGNVKKILNVSKNLVVPNKFINQAQFHVESHINNTTNMMPNNNFETLQNTNETDITEPDFHENGLYKIKELDHNNITDLGINNEENPSLEFIEIPCEDENSNCTEHHEFSIYYENIPYDDNAFIQLVENNDTNVDDSHDFGSSNTVHLKDLISKGKENKLKSAPDIYITQEHGDLDTHSLVSNKPISSYSAVPILGKDLAEVVEADSNLQSSFPVYETVDLLASDSKNSPVHPTLTFHNSPLDYVHGHQTIGSKIPQYISPKFSTSPVECSVGLKDSKYSILPSPPPLNFGFGWPPSYSPMEELRPPCAEKSFDSTFSLPVSVSPIKHPSKDFFHSPGCTSSDHTMPIEDPELFQNTPTISFDQKPCLVTSPFYLEANTPTSSKHVLPSKIDFPSTAPLSVISSKSVGAVNSRCPFQPPYLQPTKDNLGLINSPFDNNVKDIIIPSSGNRNRYPCNTLPYFLSPYLKSPQVIPPYFDSQLPGTPLQTTSKIPTDSPPISLEQSYTCLNPDYPQETKPMPLFPFAPTTPYLPFNPPWLESGFIPISPSIWNNFPTMSSSPYSVLTCQNMWNYPSTFNNYLAPTMELQQNQFLKPLPAKEAAKSVLEYSDSTKNIPRPVQMDLLNPSFSLERDLQTLSCKYGIPLSKILDSLEKEMFDAQSKTSYDSPCSTMELDSSIKNKSVVFKTNAAINDENRSGKEEILLESGLTNLTPLDSSLIGPDLDMDNAALLDSNQYQTYTVASETTGPLNAHLGLKNQPKKIVKDSLIGQHFSTLSTSNFLLNDEDRIGNAELHLESDSSSLIPLDSSLIGPHLEISPSLVLDSNMSQGGIVTSHIEAPDSSSSQILLESSLKSPHLATSSEAKPILSGEIQNIKDMISLESNLTELTPLDSPQVDLVNEHEQSEILQHEKTTITLSASADSTKSFKSVETKPNLIEEEFLHLDPSLIGPHLQTGSSSIYNDSVEQKTVTEITQNSFQNANELESIILPPSMLPTLLKEAVTADINRNVHTQDAQLNEKYNELSLQTNVELPITDISSVTPSLKETDFQIFEPTLVQPKIVKHKITSPEIINVADSEMQLDNHLIGPSILHETDFREMSQILDSVDHLENTFLNQNKKLLTVPATIDSGIEYDSSLTVPTLYKETKTHGSPNSSNFVIQHDKLTVPILDEMIESSATSSVSVTNSQLHTSTKGQSLKPGTDTTDVSRAFDSKILDSSFVGPHFSTAPFSIDEIKMIDKELQLKADLDHFTTLDSSLIGNHLDFEGLDESEISRYQNPELSGLVEEECPLEPIPVATVCPSDLQELLSKFTNVITKSHLSPSEMKPCDKLLSSVSKISSDSKNIPFEDFQTCSQLLNQDGVASEFSPIPQTVLKPNFSPSESIAKGQPCINSNFIPMPVTFPQYASAKEAPQIPITPYSPFVQMKPSLHHNWLRPPLNIQGSPGSRPVAENAPIPFISNEIEQLSSEEFKHLLDLASQSNMYPQLSIPNMFRPAEAISPLSEWTIPSQILLADNYIPFLPKKSPIVLPSDDSIYDTEYNPVVVDDIMSLINENSHQILKDMPLSQAFVLHTISELDGDHILSPSLLDYVKTRPVSSIPPIANAMSPSSFYNLHLGTYDPQYIPYMEQIPLLYNIEEAKFSKMIGPAPKLISLPTQFPNAIIESQLQDISNIPHFIESIVNPILEKEYPQQLSSKPCLDSPIVLPSSALEAMLQLPTASNEIINVPCLSPPSYLPLAYFPPASSIYSTPKSNAFSYPLLPNYASPLSVSSAKAISTSSNPLPLNLPNTASPIASPALSINPYTTSTCIPELSSPLMPVKTELSDCTYLPTVAENRLIPYVAPYKPCHTNSSPYLPVQPSPMTFDTSPYSPFISKLAPATIYSQSHQPISAPYFKPAPNVLGDLGLLEYFGPVAPVTASPIAPTQTGILSPYHGPDPTFNFTPFPDTSTQKRPPSCLSPSYLTSIPQESVNVPINFKYLPSNLISSPIPQITNQELQLLRPTALSGSCGNSPFSNANQLKPISSNIPIPTYSTKVQKLSPFSYSKIKHNEPCGKVIQSNLQTSSLTEEEPLYNVIEENIYTHNNDRGKYYQGPSFNYPLESMSYTLAPEEMTETLPEEDLIKPEGLVTSAFVNSHVYEQLSPANLCQRPGQTPYTSLYGKPCPTDHFSPPLSLTKLNQQNICDNISLIKHPASQPLKSFSPALNPTKLLYPCKDTSLNKYNILPLKNKPLLSSPYYSTTRQGIASPPIDPRVLQDITSSVFFQVPTNTPFTTVSPETLSLPPTSPVIQNNLKSYNQHASHFSPIEEFITPISPAQNVKKTKPLFSPQYMSSILQAPIKFQYSRPLYETPTHYQSFITPPTELDSSSNKIFLSPAVTSPNIVSPCFNNIVEPLSTDVNKSKWTSFTPQYTLPASLSSPVPVPITTVPFTTYLPVTTPQTAKQALTNSIIPSSLFTIPDTNLLTSTSSNKLSPSHNIPRFSLPSPTYVEHLEIVPYETLSSTLGNTVLPRNILKPNSQFSTGRFKVPTSSSPFLVQPLTPIDSYPVQPPNDQHNNKPHAILSPVSSQYASSCYTSLPLETVANRLLNKPQYDPSSIPIYDTRIHIPFSGRNPFFKPILEVPSYPIPNNLISLPKITPFDSVLLSNLRPVDMSQDPLDSYSQITPLSPLSSLSLLKPLAKPLPQKSRLHQPENNPINSQYVSPIESIPQLLPSTSPKLISPLLKPLLTNSQNAPLLPIHLFRLNTGSPESTPINYLPSILNYKYPGPSTSLLSEIPETAEPVNLLPPYSLFKSRFNKLQQIPETMASMPLYSNYEILEPAPDLLMKRNIVSIAKPIEVPALDSSLISRESSEVREEKEPTLYSKYRLSPLLMNLSQQRQFYPADTSIPKPLTKYKSLKPKLPNSAPTLISNDVELIDTTDFIPRSQIKSEPLIAEYSPTDRQASIIQNTPLTKPDISQFFPYTTLQNTEAPPTYMILPLKLQTPRYSNQFPRLPPLFLSPQEYKELIQGSSISDGLSSSSNFLTLPDFEPPLASSQLTGGARPVTLHTSPISSKPESLLQYPTIEKYLPLHEIPVEITPEKENIQTLLKKRTPYNKIAPQRVNRYPNELISSIPEVPLNQNPKSGPNGEYEDKYLNDFNEYDRENMPYDEELEHISEVENRLGSIEAKSFTETLPDIVKSLNIANYNEMAPRPQRLSKLDHFYANNQIGQSPQVFTVPAYKTLPTDRKSPSTTMSPEVFKEFSNIPTQYFSTVPRLDITSQMRPNEYYPKNENYLKNVPMTNSYPQTYLNPYSKTYSQKKFPPNAVEIADTFEIPYEPSSYSIANIDDIKYSGYKTYQIPSLKSPKSTPNLGIPTQIIDPTVVTYSPPNVAYKPLEVQQNSSDSHFYTPNEIYELHNTQSQRLVDMTTPLQTKLELDTIQESPELNEYSPLNPEFQTPADMITPLQTKLGLNTLQKSPEYDEYNPLEDVPLSVDNMNEDNELKTSLINHINNRGDVKINLDNSDGELTIPIGNIAITKKEPHNADTIKTNNPSIGLKVWKSNVKIAQAELKLKFKDLSVNNFMPVVNNIDKYDMEEIRKIVKNYIDEKYGAHIEVNEPYSVDNKYSIIKDFDHTVENKYNLLWPTHYV